MHFLNTQDILLTVLYGLSTLTRNSLRDVTELIIDCFFLKEKYGKQLVLKTAILNIFVLLLCLVADSDEYLAKSLCFT